MIRFPMVSAHFDSPAAYDALNECNDLCNIHSEYKMVYPHLEALVVSNQVNNIGYVTIATSDNLKIKSCQLYPQ